MPATRVIDWRQKHKNTYTPKISVTSEESNPHREM